MIGGYIAQPAVLLLHPLVMFLWRNEAYDIRCVVHDPNEIRTAPKATPIAT
jgi:hypothetical protein